MNKNIRFISLLLAILMISGVFLASCSDKKGSGEETTAAPSVSDTQSTDVTTQESSDVGEQSTAGTTTSTESSDTSEGTSVETTQGAGTDPGTESIGTGNNESENTDETVPNGEFETDYEEILDYDGSQMIEYADYIKDGVDAAYLDAVRSSAIISNMEMNLIHGLNGNVENTAVNNLVTALTNKQGGTYVSNTMDIFVKAKNGQTYYASEWIAGPYFNILKGGYYYNDVRISGQGFGDMEAMMSDAIDLDLSLFAPTNEAVTDFKIDENGIASYVTLNTAGDPGIKTKSDPRDSGISILTKNYNALLITMKTESAWLAEVFVQTHRMNNYSQDGAKFISLIPGDDFHTYIIRLDDLNISAGFLTGLRIDLGDINGETTQIKSIKAVKLDENTIPVRIERGLHTYSDKLHQELHFVTTDKTTDVASYGMETKIAANTVDKLIVKDKHGLHTDITDVDWDSAEYVGFDVKNVGIFGYILANHESSGKLTVTLDGDNYIIIQEYTLAADTELADESDFYMGHRIYTDESHDFAEFLHEAYIERNPLGAENIIVESSRLNKTSFVGYNYLSGSYEISIAGTSFSTAYYQIWNRHYRANITVKGDAINRKLYINAHTTSSGLECAVVLNSQDLTMPVPLEVIKNFAGDGEQSIFNDDKGYSETYVPVVADKDSEQSFSILNLYQNWGKYPLKQLSWIQFGCPYYHLSTGVTETNCIMPLYAGGPAWQLVNDPAAGKIDEFYVYSGKNLSTLPDFRAMSGILWKDQPQHNSCMDMKWLSYTTSDGSFYASENTSDKIDSYGPIYADITLDYISDDGKIDISYRHAEMPQTDENRTYYSIRMNVNGDISIDSFKNDFNIFETNSRFGAYQKLGYLNESNECIVEDADRSGERRFITLGDESPYFGYFYFIPSPDSNMCNYAVIIRDWDIVVGGEKYEKNLIIEERFLNGMNFTRLTLDLEEVTLKDGDYINVDMILLPWGKANDTEDTNVRQVRQDSCIDPFKVEASVGSVIEDEFIPKVMAENNTAEFTFSGGHNNGVVRVYGFDKLTAPTIMELVDGEWVKYDVSSETIPDKNGNYHYYDGFSTYYDGNGLYSYAFVIPTENGAERTFRVTAEDFAGFPDDPAVSMDDPVVEEDSNDSEALVDPNEARPEGEGAPKLYYSAQDLYLAAKAEGVNVHMLDSATLHREDGIKFARYLTYGAENQDAYIVLHASASESKPTGKYVAIKYRTKTPNASMEFWVNSDDMSYHPGANNSHVGIVNDGEWQYAILDLTVATSKHFNGKRLYLLRFDFLNSSTAALPANSYIDIAFIGFFDTEEEAGRFEFGDEYRTEEQKKQDNYDLCVDPESGYTLSEVVYGTNIDFINGQKITWQGGNSKQGVAVINLNSNTLSNGYLTIAGWTVVDGGVEKYIWSVDGGKTWYQVGTHIIKEIGSGAGDAHYNVIKGKIGEHTFAAGSNANSTYQVGSGEGGIAINLSDFEGQTVDVVFAAVPKTAKTTVCPLALIQNVSVFGKSGSATPDSPSTEVEKTPEEIKAENNAGLIDPSSGYTESTLTYGANLDFVNALSLPNAGGNSLYGCTTYTEEYTTIKNTFIVITGWAVVDGGVKDYVYSTDGGKTWNVIAADPGDGAGTAHYNVLKSRIGDVTFSEGSNIKSTFQGAQADGENITGLNINLSEHIGETVELIFAAIPLKEENSLCLIAKFTSITVGSASTEKTPEEIKAENNAGCIDPTSGYSESTLTYGANLDFINAQNLPSAGGNSLYGCTTYTDEYTTIKGATLVISGWFVVDSGVKNYVYSADGGKTWNIIAAQPGNGAGSAHINVLKKRMGDDLTFTGNYNINSTFQGTVADGENINGLNIDLSAYAGETVEVIFAAVPNDAPNTLCLIAKITNVTVASAQ